MELKNYLIELLSGIIQDRLKMLDDAKNNIKKANDFKRIEDFFSDVDNVVNVDKDELKNVLSEITDDDTITAIIANIEMIKIVENGISNGLDLSLDESQIALVNGVYELVSNYITELENKNVEIKASLDDFISKCESLSNDIGTGVVRDIDTLNEIFSVSDVSREDVVKAKFEILKNNSKNYNMNLDGKVKEEIDLRIALKQIDVDLDTYSDIEKRLLVSFVDVEKAKLLINYLFVNNIVLNSNQLFIVLLLSNVEIVSNIYDLCQNYKFSFEELFKIPGVFVSAENKDFVTNIINDNINDDDFYVVEYLGNIGSYYENFIKNISLLQDNGKDVLECFNSNILSLIIPDMEKNITILGKMNLTIKEFSIVVINPYLATSKSSFEECGLGEYLNSNPLRLCTSYFRLRNIASNIVDARKNGKIIFRSLSDKKNYWLAKNITKGEDNNTDVGVI